METIEGNFGIVYFCDCVKLLKSMNRKFDIAFTDPPWLVNYDKGSINYHNRKIGYGEHKIHYEENYDFNWVREWFNELKRLSNAVCLVIGVNAYLRWIKEIQDEPIGIFNRFYTNGQKGTKLAYVSGVTPYIFYGKLNRRLNFDIFHKTKTWGFLNPDRKIIKHPTPRDEIVIMRVLQESKTKSVIDPFLGSGTTAEACETLGIKYVGIELDIRYKEDIEFKIKRGIKNHKNYRKRKVIGLRNYGKDN